MKIIDSIAKRFGYLNKGVMDQRAVELIGTWVANAAPIQITERNYLQLVDAYKSWVYTCIDKIAKSIAMIPVNLFIYRIRRVRR